MCKRRRFFQLRLNNTRDDPYKLFNEFSDSSVRSTYFYEQVVNIWNRLPSQIVNFSSLSRFRKSVEVMELEALTSYKSVAFCCANFFIFGGFCKCRFSAL